MLALFIIADSAAATPGPGMRAALREEIASLPGRGAARIMFADRTPADQPFSADGTGPDLVMQIGFESLAAAQAALNAGSPLSRLPGLLGASAANISHQVMETHAFPVEPGPGPEPYCTFFVTYPGVTADLPGWLAHYDAHHPPIMRRFPRIREVETYWPVSWASDLPFARASAMQRNKVVFDTLADLVAALASPVMEEMRADGRKFPPMSAKATHYPMLTFAL